MNYRDTRRTESYIRGSEFITTRKQDLGPIADSAGAHQLFNAVGVLTTVTTTQGAASLNLVGQKADQRSLEVRIRTQLMAPLAIFARARLRGTPGITALTRATKNLEGMALVHAARAMATTASAHLQQLVEGGFPETALHELETAATGLESTIATRGATRVSRREATQSIAVATRSAREAVSMLDAVIRRQFANDAAFLAAWNTAHRVHGKPGVARGSSSAANDTPAEASPASQAAA